MDHTTELQVNLLNVDDIRAKLPEARRIYRAKLDALAAMSQDVQNFSGMLSWMAHMAGEQAKEADPWAAARQSLGDARVDTLAPTVRPKRVPSPAQDRAVAALKRAGQPMGPTALYRFMESQDLQVPTDANALGAALWNAAKNGRVSKTPDGLYALLEWEPDQPQLQDAPSGGFPKPTTEPTENGASEPPFTAPQPQEGT
jgi:hypothetical protein